MLRSIPFLGPVRVALLMAIMRTPWRFRSKRNLWGYCGLAVVTSSSLDFTLVEGRPVRRRRKPLTRGLNRNHNPLRNPSTSHARVSSDISLPEGLVPRLVELNRYAVGGESYEEVSDTEI